MTSTGPSTSVQPAVGTPKVDGLLLGATDRPQLLIDYLNHGEFDPQVRIYPTGDEYLAHPSNDDFVIDIDPDAFPHPMLGPSRRTRVDTRDDTLHEVFLADYIGWAPIVIDYTDYPESAEVRVYRSPETNTPASTVTIPLGTIKH